MNKFKETVKGYLSTAYRPALTAVEIQEELIEEMETKLTTIIAAAADTQTKSVLEQVQETLRSNDCSVGCLTAIEAEIARLSKTSKL